MRLPVISLFLLLLISCDEQDPYPNLSGKIERINVKAAYTYNKLIFDYPSSNTINIDIIDKYGDQSEPEKLVLTYDSAGILMSEKLFSSNDYIYIHNYIYKDYSLIIETITIKTSGDSTTTSDTLSLNDEGKVIGSSDNLYKWQNDNLIYYKSAEQVKSCFVPSNMGGTYLTIRYTPLTIHYKYDNKINPFKSLNLPPGNYLFGASGIAEFISFRSTNNVIEVSVIEEYTHPSGCYEKVSRSYIRKNSITYDHNYPIQMTIKDIEGEREYQIQEIFFEYLD